MSGPPRLDVVGSGGTTARSSAGWALVTDGTAAVAVGATVAGGFGVEAAKSFVADEPAGRWWFVLAFVVGLGLVALGLGLRGRGRRRVRVGIVVTAADSRRELSQARQLEEQATAFSQSTCAVTLRAGIELSQDDVLDPRLVDALAEETRSGLTMAGRLAPDAARVNLIPTMRLHVGFWFGARLGHTHAREVMVHAMRQGNGSPAYFPAVSLRVGALGAEPLIVDRLTAVDDGDPTMVALAVDVQGFGDQFFDQVQAACRQYGIGYVLRLRRSSTDRLNEDTETFSGVVEQTCRAWRAAPLPEGARNGRHAIFLNGPVAIAVALGARLAAPEHDRWTAFTRTQGGSAYEPFPALSRP
ncbi:hypothetical protein AHOG_19500 [Actinoalloteichus hoggarensis]|uniref:SAVED domain-containing protein n=1 Tax=Actinoalloteichus hoggarensis TaxID=1470176 RepID=A0A221W6G4_9PSEU|nr:hypothetical protein AHOG_19500 [Actinoalloteichus hoggarensis]